MMLINLELTHRTFFFKPNLTISLRSYRTSLLEGKNNTRIQFLSEVGLIKESNSPYSAPVTLANAMKVKKPIVCRLS